MRFRVARNRRDKRACERETALLCLYFGTNHHRSDGSEVSRRRWHRLGRQQHLRSSPLLWCTATSSSPKTAPESGLKPFSKPCEFISVKRHSRKIFCTTSPRAKRTGNHDANKHTHTHTFGCANEREGGGRGGESSGELQQMPIEYPAHHSLTAQAPLCPSPCTRRMQSYQLSSAAANEVRKGAVVFNVVTQWVGDDTSGLGCALSSPLLPWW